MDMTPKHTVKIFCGRHWVCSVFLLIWTLLAVFPSSVHAAGNVKPKQSRFHQIIVRVAKHYRVEIDLVKAIIRVESGYHPNAVSRSGAKGLMQLMPLTAEALGVTDCFDPAQNIEAGVRYFNKLKKEFSGSIVLALAAYNAGPGRVKKCGGIPDLGRTKQYIMKVLDFYAAYEQADSEGFQDDNANDG